MGDAKDAKRASANRLTHAQAFDFLCVLCAPLRPLRTEIQPTAMPPSMFDARISAQPGRVPGNWSCDLTQQHQRDDLHSRKMANPTKSWLV